MELSMWGALTPGPYAVGFRTRYACDYSRRYASTFRPIFLATWYPATATAVPALTYGDYLHVETDEETFAAFSRRLTTYLRDTTIQYGLEKKPEALDEAGREELARREALSLSAVRDAPPEPGSFPVVIYHPGLGGSYEDNGVLCEYLASHGYLVVSSAYQPEDSGSLQLDWDLERSTRDLGFLMNALAADPQADLDRIGAVGQSYGAQALLSWSSEVNTPVRAVVSLDSTVDYFPADAPGFAALKQRLARVENVTAAWLLFAVQGPELNWAQWDYLVRTPRWLAATGPMGHNDFTAQGLIGTLLRHADSDEARRLRQRYESICRLLHAFLDAYLKGDSATKEQLLRRAASDPVTGDPLVEVAYRSPESRS